MMAADIVEAAIDPVPDEMVPDETVGTDSMDPIAVDEWQACDPFVCDLQPYDFVDPTPAVDPVIIDDSCLLIDDSSLMVCEPIDVRVQYVSSETEPGWAAYYYTVGADGVVQGVSVVASYDEPTIAAFVAEHADDPEVQIFDYGDGWWISGFPLELAPPVPEYGVFSSGDDVAAYGSTDDGTADGSDSVDVIGGWSWDESTGSYTWIDGAAGGGDWTANWDESATAYTDDGSYSTPSYTDVRVQYVSSETEPGWAAYYYTVGADGVGQDVSVWASYDEPTIAAFLAEHADDPEVQIFDYGDGWCISGFPLELAPPVPDAVSWCGLGGGDGTAYESTDVGVWDPSGSLNIASDWSWDGTDAVYTWDGTAGFGGDGTSTWDDSGVLYISDWSLRQFCADWTCTLLPSAYARGADVSESFVAYAAAADAEPAEPVSVSPRSAAFADMGTMAAAATAMQASSAEAVVIGGGRRRR